VLGKAIARDRGDRYATAADFERALHLLRGPREHGAKRTAMK